MKPMRYAHSEGHLDLCYDEDGDHIITCGPDGDVRIYEGFEDDDPISHRSGEVVYAVAYKNYRFYTGTDDHAVQAYLFKEGQADGIVTRFTAPVVHMAFNKDGSKLVAGSSDFTAKVVDVETSNQKLFQGHDAPILSVALSPEETFLATSSCDGSVKVWRLDDQKCVKTIAGLPKNNDFGTSTTLCRLTWHSSKLLLVPINKEVKAYDTQSWDVSYTLTDDSIKEVLSVLARSPCGRYLAGACRDGVLLVWDLSHNKCIYREKHEKGHTITGLAWNPKNNEELAFCDNNGYLGLAENVLSASKAVSSEMTEEAKEFADLFDDDDDMLVEATSRNVAQSAADGDEEDEEDDNDLGTQKKKPVTCIDDDVSRDTDFGTAALSLADGMADQGDADSVHTLPLPAPQPVQVKGYQPTALQKPFQSGSSPAYLSHRFMVWNSVGIVIQYNTEEENSINVEFHDTATHHAMHVTNTLNHTLADLSAEAILLACPSDNDAPSQLVCMHFGSWDNCKEWSVPMPEGEDIEALCLGEGWLAVATDARLVRLFTIGGVQQEVLCLPGPVVTMTAHSNQLAVVYHKAAGIPGDQCLGIKLQHVTGKKKTVLDGLDLPLTHKATLAWLGFSAEGTPFAVDSAGLVRMLNRGFGHTWVPVANLRKHCKGKSDNYWLVGVHENPQQLRTILCKGARYPPTLPRPMLHVLPFVLPLCEAGSDKGNMEEAYWRSVVFSRHLDWWDGQGYEVDQTARTKAHIPQQEALMKLFALACKTEREYRAVELCRLMPNQHTVQLAIKYASRLRMLQLAQRLNDVARSKAEEEMLRAQREALRARADDEGEEDEEEQEEEGDGAARADFTSGLDAVHSHVSTEWSHAHGHKAAAPRQRDAAVADKEEEVEEEEEDVDMDQDDHNASGDIYEEIEEDEEKKKATGPMLNLKSKKDKDDSPKPLFPSQSSKKNPFKVSSQKTPTTGKGTSVFDGLGKSKPSSRPFMTLKSPEEKGSKRQSKGLLPKKSDQKKLFSSQKSNISKNTKDTKDTKDQSESGAKKVRTGFQVWFDANREELEEEHPDLGSDDLTLAAAKAFKALSKDEQQDWKVKADGEDDAKTKADADSKKRKRDEDNADDDLENKDQLPKAAKKVPAKSNLGNKKSLSGNATSKLAGFAFAKKD